MLRRMDGTEQEIFNTLTSTLSTIVLTVKQLTANRHGVGTDMREVLILHNPDGTLGLVIPVLDRSRIPESIAETDARFASLVSEAYVWLGVDEPEDSFPLAEMFAAHHPDVQECVCLSIACQSGSFAVSWPYRYDGTMVRWGMPVNSSSELSTVRLLTEGFERQVIRDREGAPILDYPTACEQAGMV